MGAASLSAATVDWGDVPNWITSLATVVALAFAAVAAAIARRTYQIESERDRVNEAARREQEDYQRQAQAAQVSAWWGTHDGTPGAFVRNASGTPVYQVYLTVLGPDDRTDGTKTHFLVVPPSEHAEFCPIRLTDVETGMSENPVRRVKLTFTDAVGVRWLRDRYGRLTELDPRLRVQADQPRADALSRFDDDFLATLLNRSMGFQEAADLFAGGRTAFLLTTSDGLRHARRAGVPLAVDPVPPFADGAPAVPLSLVHGLVMARNGSNRMIAHDLFAEYLSQSKVMAALSGEVVGPTALRSTVSKDAGVRRYQELCEAAIPMPAFRGMHGVWRALRVAETAVVAGAPAAEAARAAARAVRDAVG